ncbi:MAG: carbohydrate ABC transporter permease [Catonella sp.]|nr:carbohydrate ABC transporter permease [Catonella sp.]MDY6357308.1 carbohydrate ABC transporter permease [Catonella sp.]
MAKEKVQMIAKKHHKHYKPGDVVFNIINYTVFAIFTFICFFPFYYLFINTISDNTLVSKGLITFYPRGIHFGNYVRLFEVNDLFQSFWVTIARTVIGTALMVMASGFIGYLVTRKQMWHRSLWYRFLVVTMYFNAGIIPWYMNMSMLGLTNNFMAYILPGIVAPYNIILVKTYIESAIPAALEESAELDGASTMQVFTKIIWPLSKPILATIAIFGAVGNWNSFQDSLILMQSAPKLYTLQHRLYIYLNTTSNLGALMKSASSGISQQVVASALSGKVIKYTISMVTIIPILLVYPFMQRYFEKGIMLGAVKG